MFLPNHRLNQRYSAYADHFGLVGLANASGESKLGCAVNRQAYFKQAAHHFRTPSPRGQLAFVFRKLPTFCLADKCLKWRCFAEFPTGYHLPTHGGSPISGIEANLTQKGPQKCVSKHGSSPQQLLQGCQLAEKKYRNKRSTARGRVSPQPSFWMAKCSPVPSSARPVTCSTARQIRVSATKRTTRFTDLTLNLQRGASATANRPPLASRAGRFFVFASSRTGT